MKNYPIRVLLVDDDEDDYIITRDLLSDIEGKRFDLDWVSTYDAALETIEQRDHHVYLLDYRLGERNGLELLKEAIISGCKAPLILLTGQGDHEIDLKAMKAGAADYLIKGQIDPPLLERAIRYAIERARLVEGLEAEVAARTAEIRAEKEKSETILRNAGDAILMADHEMMIRYVNPAFSTLTGYTAPEVMGKDTDSVLDRMMSEQIIESVKAALAQGKQWEGEATIRRKDGRTYDAMLTIAPMRDDQDRPAGYVSSHRDINQLKELDRARNRFLASVSHELRTPVTNLKLYGQLLRMGQESGKVTQYVEALDRQTDRLSNLVQDILEMTELDSGDAVAFWAPIYLSTVIETVMTRHQGQAHTADLSLTATPLPPDLPPVKGDATRLTQALDELVENAVLFNSPGGQVTITPGTAKEEGQCWVTLAVCDTGPGISPEEQARIFDRFYRGSAAEAGHIPGSGLGLSKVYEIMRAHGGQVTVTSQVDRGSTFTLWLRPEPSQTTASDSDRAERVEDAQ